MDHFQEIFANFADFLVKNVRSGSRFVTIIQDPGQKVPDRTGSGSISLLGGSPSVILKVW